MPIRDILLQVDPGAANATRLDLAVDLARRHDAHLIGLSVFDLALLPGAGFGYLNAEDALALNHWQEQLRTEAMAEGARMREAFEERLRREAISGEWRLVEGNAITTVAQHARYADLTVLGQADPDDRRIRDWSRLVEGAVLNSGRPVLVVPYAGTFERVGQRVLVGWNAGREAARAVHDALPLLTRAEAVTVLSVDPRKGMAHGEPPGAAIAAHLARHGVVATAQEANSDGLSAADILLNHAADFGIDLIVIGGYGHSRFREVVLGGVTHALLHQATVPVLMSH